jgi:DNA-binding NarL/FixJ family response regulator
MGEFTEQRIFNEFLTDGIIFIIDENPSSMRRLIQVLQGLGAQSGKIHRFGSLVEAEEKLKTMKLEQSIPKLVICDYNVGAYSGLDFFQTVRDQEPDSHKSAFVIVTANMDQSAVARAAEEDVDAYIIKPFTFEGIKEVILTTVQSKIKPSEYMILIKKAKDFIGERKFDDALKSLKAAFKKSKSPTLAHYYLGVLKNAIEQDQEAKDSYKEGLKYNKIHFKCQKRFV